MNSNAACTPRVTKQSNRERSRFNDRVTLSPWGAELRPPTTHIAALT